MIDHIAAVAIADALQAYAKEITAHAPHDRIGPIRIVNIVTVGDDLVALASSQADRDPFTKEDFKALMMELAEAPAHDVREEGPPLWM